MQEVSYAGGRFVTSDEVADALLSYAAALANAERAATIDVPAVAPDGPGVVKVLVGPASQIVAEPIAQDGPELDASAFLDEVREAILRQQEKPRLPEQGSALDWDV